MTEQWTPKVGDRVRVTGFAVSGTASGAFFNGVEAEVDDVDGDFVWVFDGYRTHIRNLDPVLEDERKGAPRPKPIKGESLIVEFLARSGENVTITRTDENGIEHFETEILRRQIERRISDRGREARGK